MPKNVSVFLDLSNINCAFGIIKKMRTISASTKIDFAKFVSVIVGEDTVISRSAYIGIPPHTDHRTFIDYFKNNSFTIVTKPCKIIRLDDGSEKWKANFDVEITWDISSHIQKYLHDEIILFSGDSDFAYLVDKLHNKHINTTIVSSEKTISTELRNKADRVVLLDDLALASYTFERAKNKNMQ